MTTYHAKSDRSLIFELTHNDQSIGKLRYKSWFKFSAEVELAHYTTYQIEPKGFWGTTIELKSGEDILLSFNLNWSGEIVVQTYFSGREKGYVFKHRGFFKESYLLLDEKGTELLVVKPHLKWNNFGCEYEITTSDAFDTFANKELLLLTVVHCANYYMAMMMGSGVVPGV